MHSKVKDDENFLGIVLLGVQDVIWKKKSLVANKVEIFGSRQLCFCFFFMLLASAIVVKKSPCLLVR